MRGALVWLGCSDPARSIEEVREADPKLHALRAAIGFLYDLFVTGPFSVAEIIDVCSWGSTVDDEKGNRETLPGWRGPFERKIPEKEHAEFRELFYQSLACAASSTGSGLRTG